MKASKTSSRELLKLPERSSPYSRRNLRIESSIFQKDASQISRSSFPNFQDVALKILLLEALQVSRMKFLELSEEGSPNFQEDKFPEELSLNFQEDTFKASRRIRLKIQIV